MPVYAGWFSWTSFIRYSWSALMNNQFQNTTSGHYEGFIGGPFGNETQNVFEFYGLQGPVMGSTGVCIALLIAILLVFVTCGIACLQWLPHNTR